MKAIVYTEYGGPDVLRLQKVSKPLPKANEVLIKIHAVSVNYGDILARNFKNIPAHEFNMPFLFWLLARFSFGFNRPRRKILGNTFSGEIEAVGDKVKEFTKGEHVFGYTGEKMGSYVENLCLPQSSMLEVKPANLTFQEASPLPYGAIMALNLLRKANIQKGHNILIIGASGEIGSSAVQIAKNHFGANVSGVCSTESIDFVKCLGTDKVIDYKKENFTKNDEKYDLIFDIMGKGAFSRYKNSLKVNGTYLLASFKTKKILQMLWTSLTNKKKVICGLAIPKKEDLIMIRELVEDEKLKPLIDQCFPLEKTAEAHHYIESRRKKGSVIITV